MSTIHREAEGSVNLCCTRTQGVVLLAMESFCGPFVRDWLAQVPTCAMKLLYTHHTGRTTSVILHWRRTMTFESTAKVLANCMLKYYRISE